MIFPNRMRAAYALIEKLQEYRGTHPLVLAIPRGAVPMGEVIVESLGGDLDVVLGGAGNQETRRDYSPLLPPPEAHGRTVIVVDDGGASGETVLAALRSVRARQPRRLVFASPAVTPETLQDVQSEANEVIALSVPERIGAVADLYQNAETITDDDVIRTLSESRKLSPRRDAIERGHDPQPAESPDSHQIFII